MDKRRIFREGQRFGKLVTISYVKSKKYLCYCDCGNQKIIRTCNLTHGFTKSCGCISSINRENYNDEMKNKLLKFIKINEKGCWEWQKSKNKQGYGQFSYKRKNMLAHRISWMLFKDNIESDILVCHHCDNPKCVNPDHLFLGTDKDNTLDYIKKGRANKAKGSDHGSAKMNDEIIKEIRSLASEGFIYKDIAKKLNIAIGNISGIVTRKSWKHVV